MNPDSTSTLRAAPRRFGRGRRLVFAAAERVARALGGRAFYRWRYLARTRLVVRREDVLVPGLPRDLEGFTVAHLSDLHAGPFLADGDLATVVETVGAAQPDLVAFTGDLIAHHWTDSLGVLEELAALRSRHGTFAVFGNHDYRGREEGRIAQAFGERGVRFLRNEHVQLHVGAARLAVIGLEDVEEGRSVDLPGARRGLAEGTLEVVLCHNPGAARRLAAPGRPLVLSGHTHGGQMDVPFLRHLGPSHPGIRVDFGPTTLIVSRGLGVVGVPLRMGAPAEVVLVRLMPAPGIPGSRGAAVH